MRICSRSVKHTREIGRLIADLLQAGDVLVLNGDLGAGKTHLTQGIGEQLGSDHQVTSPTFTIVDQHALPLAADGQHKPTTLFHFDLYRIEDAQALDDIDFIGMIESPGAVSIIEWGDRFVDELPDDYVEITLRRAYTAHEIDGALEVSKIVDGVDAADEALACVHMIHGKEDAHYRSLTVAAQDVSEDDREELDDECEPARILEFCPHGSRAHEMVQMLEDQLSPQTD